MHPSSRPPRSFAAGISYRKSLTPTCHSLLVLVCSVFLVGCGAIMDTVGVSEIDPAKLQRGIAPSGMYYALPKCRLKLTLERAEIGKSVTFTVTKIHEADHRFGFLSVLKHKKTSDDILTITVDGETSLLSSVTADTTDKIPDIAGKLASIASKAITASQGMVTAQAGSETFKYEIIVDPDRDPSGPIGGAYRYELNSALGGALETLRRNQGDKLSSDSRQVYYRVNLPCDVRVYEGGKASVPIFSEVVMIPNQSPAFAMDVTRAFAVQKVTTLTFSNGVLASSSVNHPSEVLGFLSIPIKILDELTNVLPFKLKSDKATAEAAYLAKLVEIQTAQAALAKKAASGNSPNP